MKQITKLGWLHVVLSVCGAVLCVTGREGAGTMVLCMSVMCLMVVKVEEIIAPDSRDEIADMSTEIGQMREAANVVYRRAITLGSYLDSKGEELGGLAPQLAKILREIDSSESTVDAEIIRLRESGGRSAIRTSGSSCDALS
jgi:hypothetical protein